MPGQKTNYSLLTVALIVISVIAKIDPEGRISNTPSSEGSKINIMFEQDDIDGDIRNSQNYVYTGLQNENLQKLLGEDQSQQTQKNTDFSFYECEIMNNCEIGEICENGRCVMDTPKPISCRQTCQRGYRCQNGACVNLDKCVGVNCKEGTKCRFGKCVQEKKSCSKDMDCTQDQRCRSGKCTNACKIKKCRGGTFCVHGNCLNQPNKACGNLGICPKGMFCKNNTCVPNVEICPRNARFNASMCMEPRPNEKNCQSMMGIQTPDLNFCGVREDGTRYNFARQCEACKDTKIIYYFDRPCHKVPFGCNQDETCLGYYCSKKGCKNDKECPYDWQTCLKGKCVDSCIILKCHGCKFGQCQFEQPKGECSVLNGVSCKKQSWACIGNSCVDRCLKIPCLPDHKCQAGICIKK